GRDVVRDYRFTRRAVGLVPQEINFDPFFTVEETLRFQAGYFGVRLDDARIDDILGNLSLREKRNANTRALSGGMKRRLLIAKALVHDPPVLFLDEPTAGVDVELRRDLWAYVKRLASAGTTVVLTPRMGEPLAAPLQALAASGLRINDVQTREPRLETVIVDLLNSPTAVAQATNGATALERPVPPLPPPSEPIEPALGMRTLYAKEVKRFLRVPGQTILSPLITTALYFVVFG